MRVATFEPVVGRPEACPGVGLAGEIGAGGLRAVGQVREVGVVLQVPLEDVLRELREPCAEGLWGVGVEEQAVEGARGVRLCARGAGVGGLRLPEMSAPWSFEFASSTVRDSQPSFS